MRAKRGAGRDAERHATAAIGLARQAAPIHPGGPRKRWTHVGDDGDDVPPVPGQVRAAVVRRGQDGFDVRTQGARA